MYLKSSTSPARSLRNPIETETDSIDIGHTSTKDFPSEPGVPAWSTCLPTATDDVVSLTQNTPSPYPLVRIPPAAATKPIVAAHASWNPDKHHWKLVNETSRDRIHDICLSTSSFLIGKDSSSRCKQASASIRSLPLQIRTVDDAHQ